MSYATWSGAVMTHPERMQDRAWFPSWPRVVDDGRGLTRNFCATLRAAAAAGAEWSVLAQDDVEPARGLEEALPRILSEVQDAPIAAFFSMRRVRDPMAVAAGVRWRYRRRGELLWVMLLAVRTEIVDAVASGVAEQTRPADAAGGRHATAGCDERLSLWLDAQRIPAVIHLPSLVQHRGTSSIIGHSWRIGGRPRESPTFDGMASIETLCRWEKAP